MFPPLASTSWTEMLMPLLLFANEMLLVTHEFDLKYNTNKVKPPSISLYEVLQKKKFIISPRGSRKIKQFSHNCSKLSIIMYHWKNNLIVKIHRMSLYLSFIENCLYFKEFQIKLFVTSILRLTLENFRATFLMNRLKNRSPSLVFGISPLSARWNSSDAQDPRVANAIARCHLRRFRCQTQHAHLAHVAVAVAHPNVSRALSIG